MSYCFEHALPHSKFLSWRPEDRAKVLAYAMEQALRCNMCGTASWEWEENRFAYTAVEELCQGCYQKSRFQDTESNSLPGTNIKLIPTTPDLKAKMSVTARKRAKKLAQDEDVSGRRNHQPERRTDSGQQSVRPGDDGLGRTDPGASRLSRQPH